jgi:hypothetical protein
MGVNVWDDKEGEDTDSTDTVLDDSSLAVNESTQGATPFSVTSCQCHGVSVQ